MSLVSVCMRALSLYDSRSACGLKKRASTIEVLNKKTLPGQKVASPTAHFFLSRRQRCGASKSLPPELQALADANQGFLFSVASSRRGDGVLPHMEHAMVNEAGKRVWSSSAAVLESLVAASWLLASEPFAVLFRGREAAPHRSWVPGIPTRSADITSLYWISKERTARPAATPHARDLSVQDPRYCKARHEADCREALPATPNFPCYGT
ncbi:hypothetical protein QBC34DRAFT_178926 [Podospora aff. communis PSN243]|uniref:Uncharacterized protein n=1 Tax=Podospora aff. communis PSN243 TaxID=3040156 RepID=A0AAV9G7Q0_9PEZI|nr:hypothetical protein QBC34DRAFT_178926 [Podospora aff. communis PSN243]